MKSFEHTGAWWIPTHIDEHFGGKLSFRPGAGGILEIKEVHESNTGLSVLKSNSIDIIQGYVDDTKYVTLLGCRWSKSPSTFTGKNDTSNVTYAILDVDYVLINISCAGDMYFHDKEAMRFETLSVSYPYLLEWLYEPNLESFDRETHRYLDSDFEPKEISIENPKVTLSFNDSTIAIRSETHLHLFEYLELINVHLADFLTFATSHTNFPTRVNGFSQNRMFEIYYPVTGYGEKVEEFLTSYEMLFTYRDVKDDLDLYLSNWISNRERLRPVYDLFLKPYYRLITEFETAFLFLAQALEATHRKEFPNNKYCPKSKYKQIRKTLINAIPETVEQDHREHLESIIGRMGNAYSLKRRILELLDDISNKSETGKIKEILDDIIGCDWNDYAVRIRDTRDFLTHHEKPTKNVIPSDQLPQYVWKTQMLIKLFFLLKIGFDSRRVEHLIEETSADYWYLRLTSELNKNP